MYIAKNNARAQLAGTLLIGDLVANLEAGKGALFAVTAPEWTYITAFDGSGNIEHMKVTARATDALTLVRAQDGTAAREWPVGTYIECRPIAAALADYAVAPQINGATAETSIADADEVGFVDASASNVLKKITWANVKATLKTYFDTLYRAVTGDVTLAAGANLVFEGSTDDGFETTVSADDPTADRSITLPDYSGAIAVRARGADIASAATVDLDAATGDIADVTGTTSVTAITLADGVEKSVRFTGALTLTNGASLVLPGAANITTAAGDVAVFRGYAAGVVRCVGYQRASGLPVVAPASLVHGAVVDVNSSTAHSLGASLPSTVKRFSVAFSNISTNGSSVPVIQLGDSGGLENSGYANYCSRITAGAAASDDGVVAGAPIYNTVVGHPSNTSSGLFDFMLVDAATNTWSYSGHCYGGSGLHMIQGVKSLSGTLDRVSFTTVNGTDVFDGSGKASMQYWTT